MNISHNNKCSKCGKDIEETEWGMFFDISVIVADREEGFAYVTQYLCDTCFDVMLDAIIELGFVDHRHGGINYLEDMNCCDGENAYENCPTPSKYGQYIVNYIEEENE